jgi:hypothetical protein
MIDVSLFLSMIDNISVASRDNIYIYNIRSDKKTPESIFGKHLFSVIFARMCKNNRLLSIALIFLILNSFFIFCFSSSPRSENDDVIELNHHNFHSKTKQYDPLLVMFYTNRCSHCHRLNHEYERAATRLLRDHHPIHLAKFDCSHEKDAHCSRRYQVDDYPTLRIYRHGNYNGEELNHHNRTTDEIIKTMRALKKSRHEPWHTRAPPTPGVEDRPNKATDNVQHIWLFIGLFMALLQTYII